MALGPWMGIYISVSDDLMAARREQELLLLMAIARHADPLGFCFPGRARLMALRHAGDRKHDERLAFLVDHHYVIYSEVYDHRRRHTMPEYQVSPHAMYIRPEMQDYCEAVFFDGKPRDFDIEQLWYVSLLCEKDSQPDSLTRGINQTQEPASGTSSKTRNHNQLFAAREPDKATTMRNAPKPVQRTSANQRRPAQQQKEESPLRDSDEFHALLSDDVDDDRIAQEIKLLVSTTLKQAKKAVATYPREGIVFWLEHTARRRQKGELSKPGGYFFNLLQKHVAPINIPGPNGQFDTSD